MSQVKAIAKELIRRELVARDLMAFTQNFERNYQPGWVHYDICKRLEQFSQDVADQKSPRLMLLIPPRHGKSTLASQMFPAWHLGRYPHHEFMNVGYNLDLPTKFSRRVRQILGFEDYRNIFPDTKLDPRSQSVESWLTTELGGFKAAGVGGGLTGMGAHVMVIDDPIKNMEEADNFEHREKLEDWYFSVAYTRLAPGGGVLIIETMWHDDDLAGRLMSKMDASPEADQFTVVRYPALSEKYEYRHRETYAMYADSEAIYQDKPEWELLREPGVALHRERYDEVFLNRVRQNSPERVWSALYQQNPVPESGLFFTEDDFHMLPAFPEYEYSRFFMAWDFAISEKQHADYTVGVCLMMDRHERLYLVDMARFRGGAQRIATEFVNMIHRWDRFKGSNINIGVEDGQIWKAMSLIIKGAMREERLHHPITTLTALSDKRVRANPLQGRMQNRALYFRGDVKGFSDLKKEFLRFPAGKHDDIVDAMSWAVRLANEFRPVMKPNQRRKTSWKDKLNKAARLNIDGTHMSA